MKTSTTQDDKRERAAQRIKALKGFYIHLTVYILVNCMISAVSVVGNMSSGESLIEAFTTFGTFSTWIFWGIGLFFHGAKVFSFNPIFSKEWEQRKIKQYLEEDTSDINKYS
ncbi:2TM domain-containing protein [Cellulophaga sp. Z1A5H]|uniref:2TM domain-containing protein n=1 Tax=Cellulophaga sp. Z1A5H TaxID=2687291 RepID=UPI0013FD42C2|nr:2TM domain-containing protein [Cellulophaga sp. Z1A5H]